MRCGTEVTYLKKVHLKFSIYIPIWQSIPFTFPSLIIHFFLDVNGLLNYWIKILFLIIILFLIDETFFILPFIWTTISLSNYFITLLNPSCTAWSSIFYSVLLASLSVFVRSSHEYVFIFGFLCFHLWAPGFYLEITCDS